MPDGAVAPSQETDALIGFPSTKVSRFLKVRRVESRSGLHICAFHGGSMHSYLGVPGVTCNERMTPSSHLWRVY